MKPGFMGQPLIFMPGGNTAHGAAPKNLSADARKNIYPPWELARRKRSV